jgi:hypothetical protein
MVRVKFTKKHTKITFKVKHRSQVLMIGMFLFSSGNSATENAGASLPRSGFVEPFSNPDLDGDRRSGRGRSKHHAKPLSGKRGITTAAPETAPAPAGKTENPPQGRRMPDPSQSSIVASPVQLPCRQRQPEPGWWKLLPQGGDLSMTPQPAIRRETVLGEGGEICSRALRKR